MLCIFIMGLFALLLGVVLYLFIIFYKISLVKESAIVEIKSDYYISSF